MELDELRRPTALSLAVPFAALIAAPAALADGPQTQSTGPQPITVAGKPAGHKHHKKTKKKKSATGATGPLGATDVAGVTGPTGATGTAGSGAILMSTSGTPVALTTIARDLVGNVAELPPEGSGSTSATGGATIDTSGAATQAESMPRAGTITSVSAYASTTAALTLIGSTVLIQAQLYESTTPNDTFSPVAGATVTLSPSLTGLLAMGTHSSPTATGLSIPVTNQTRLTFVFSTTAAGGTLVNTTTATVSAGVGIS